MTRARGKDAPWFAALLLIITAGILSRAFHSGHPLLDKYLGDTLYAAMLCVLLRLSGRIRNIPLAAALILLAIESFQLTGIPAALSRSDHLPIRLTARLLGTHFHWADLLAYALGILPFTFLPPTPRPMQEKFPPPTRS
ncbi:MAG: DUF2809 domain-containing protein [Acidobacteriota bacterium]